MPLGRRIEEWVRRFEGIVCLPDDDAEARTRKAQFALTMTSIIPHCALWGTLYLVAGAPLAAMMPYAYGVGSLINLAVLRRTGRFRTYQVGELLLILLLPFFLQLFLGGYVAGSAVVVWSILCPLAAVLFVPAREAVRWFLAFVGLLVLALVLQPTLALGDELPHGLVQVLFVMNIGVSTSIAFGLLVSFVGARDRLRALERAYVDQTVVLRQREKLATLGTLAAGVAHELNNPAAAVARAAEQLGATLGQVSDGALLLSGPARVPAGAGADGASPLASLGQAPPPSANGLSPLEQSDREGRVEEWLDDHGVPEPWELAPTLVAVGAGPDALDALADEVPRERLPALVGLLAHASAARGLADGIADGSARISEIVGALRSYAYLDRGAVQVVDVREGLESTLVLLRSKLKGMEVERRYADGLPRIEVRGNELNQVWTNLIDNAVDATGGAGTLRVRTSAADGHVVVEVEDDGPGIPEGIVERVFDPFFTTKAPGSGTGLGLNISHTIVAQHGGELSVQSQPGRTTFRVAIPVAGR